MADMRTEGSRSFSASAVLTREPRPGPLPYPCILLPGGGTQAHYLPVTCELLVSRMCRSIGLRQLGKDAAQSTALASTAAGGNYVAKEERKNFPDRKRQGAGVHWRAVFGR
jgi:hypothetical protein